MKKFLALVLVVCLCVPMLACGLSKPAKPEPITEEEVKSVLETLLEPQIQAYEEAFGVDDISVDIQFKECEIHEPVWNPVYNEIASDGWVSYYIRDIIISPTFFKMLSQGEFTDDMLKQLSAIEFEYPEIKHGDYKIFGLSALACPKFADEEGNEYTVSEGILLKGDIIAYIASDAYLEFPAKVGDNINAIFAANVGSGGGGSSSGSSGRTKCPNCKGSGYVKYYYGSSDLEAFLDGYDPYTVGECPLCDGKGY